MWKTLLEENSLPPVVGRLFRFYRDGPDGRDRYELYKLAEDPSERTNLADKMPDKAEKLKESLDVFLKEVEAAVPE